MHHGPLTPARPAPPAPRTTFLRTEGADRFADDRTKRLMQAGGARVRGADGRHVGYAGGVLVDRIAGVPSWLLVHTGRTGSRCVPIRRSVLVGGTIRVAYDSAIILSTPRVPEDGGLLARHEQALCRAYAVPLTRGARQSVWERRRTAAVASMHDGALAWEQRPNRPGGWRSPADAPLRLLIVAPDGEARAALALAAGRNPRITLRGAIAGREEAIPDEPFDVAVLSADLPRGDAPAIRERLSKQCPDARFVLLADEQHPDDARDTRTLSLLAATPAGTVLEAAEILVRGTAAIRLP